MYYIWNVFGVFVSIKWHWVFPVVLTECYKDSLWKPHFYCPLLLVTVKLQQVFRHSLLPLNEYFLN